MVIPINVNTSVAKTRRIIQEKKPISPSSSGTYLLLSSADAHFSIRINMTKKYSTFG